MSERLIDAMYYEKTEGTVEFWIKKRGRIFGYLFKRWRFKCYALDKLPKRYKRMFVKIEDEGFPSGLPKGWREKS